MGSNEDQPDMILTVMDVKDFPCEALPAQLPLGFTISFQLAGSPSKLETSRVEGPE